MKLGIVGAGAEKFSPETARNARIAIDWLIRSMKATLVISGHSPMGGVDIWAEEMAERNGVPTRIFAPRFNRWSGAGGFKERNLRIATESDVVACVVVNVLPPDYKGGIAFDQCYHCQGHNPPHVKSGGCWTAWHARERRWIFINNRLEATCPSTPSDPQTD